MGLLSNCNLQMKNVFEAFRFDSTAPVCKLTDLPTLSQLHNLPTTGLNYYFNIFRACYCLKLNILVSKYTVSIEPNRMVDSGGPVVIILATGSEVRETKPGWGRWIFSERKNPLAQCRRFTARKRTSSRN